MKNLILVAEDNEDLRTIITFFIKSIGYTSVFATNGQEAYELILAKGEDQFVAILSDIRMPVMSGFDFLINLRRQNIHIPFIFMTAAPTKESINRAFELGITEILQKPFDGKQLQASLNRLFRAT